MSELLAATAGSAPIKYRLSKLWNPGWYQDGRKRQSYFEGWFLKCVDAAAQHAIALIPGISLTPDGEGSHAFPISPTAGVRRHTYDPISEPTVRLDRALQRLRLPIGVLPSSSGRRGTE